MKESSLNYIIDILKGNKPKDDPDWFEVIGFLELHKTGGMFYIKTKELKIKLPVKVQKHLDCVFNQQKRRVIFLRKYISEISKNLIDKSIEHVFLKGSIFSNTKSKLSIYEDGMRNSNDIDILVKPNSIDKITKLLCDLGFIQGIYDVDNNTIIPFSRKEIITRRMNRGEIAPFIKLTNVEEIPYIEVDVNFSLGNTPTDYTDLLNYMIDNRVLHHRDFDIYGLDNELFFIHLIMHQYKESTLLFMVKRNKDLDLYKLADLYYLYTFNSFSKIRLRKIIEKYKIEGKLALVLNQVGEIFKDHKILEYITKYETEEHIIVDYENDKKYRFSLSLINRIKEFDNTKFLIEYHNKPFYRWEYPIDFFRGPKDDN